MEPWRGGKSLLTRTWYTHVCGHACFNGRLPGWDAKPTRGKWYLLCALRPAVYLQWCESRWRSHWLCRPVNAHTHTHTHTHTCAIMVSWILSLYSLMQMVTQPGISGLLCNLEFKRTDSRWRQSLYIHSCIITETHYHGGLGAMNSLAYGSSVAASVILYYIT